MTKALKHAPFIWSATLVLGATATADRSSAQSPYYPASACSRLAPAAQRDCNFKRLQQKERQMLSLLTQARASLAGRQAQRENWQHDGRGDPSHLDRSQAAWATFIENNCKVIAVYPGGTSSAVSDRAAGCRENEIDARLRFLRHLVEETGPFGV